MSQIVNESTSVVQIDSSGLQNGQTSIVYVSTTSIPGQLVTIMDATGYTSSPQSILISTQATQFSDGTFSTLIQQRYGYLTLVSQPNNTWTVVNSNSFLNPNLPSFYKGVDAGTQIQTSTFHARTHVSTVRSLLRSMDVLSSFSLVSGSLTASTVYVNGYSSFISSSPIDYRLTVFGSEYISGTVLATGAASFRNSISTSGNYFNTGSISSKLGTIYVGGNVTTMSSIRAQRGFQMTVQGLSSYTTAGFVGPVTITSTTQVGTFLRATNITTDNASGTNANIMSSIVFSPSQAIQNRSGYLNFVGLPATVPSTINSVNVTGSNAITTSNITLQDFTPAPTISYITLSSTRITNAGGSLNISSIQGTSLQAAEIYTQEAKDKTDFAVTSVLMNDQNQGSSVTISYTGGSFQVPVYWTISSIGTNGSLTAPLTTMSTNRFVTRDVRAQRLTTVTNDVTNFYTSNVIARDNVMFGDGNIITAKNTFINNAGGSIVGSRTETLLTTQCSSMRADLISTGSASVRFLGSNTFSLPTTYISTARFNAGTTSSFTLRQLTTGTSAQYSTMNESTPWLLVSTFQMNTTPFNTTIGLGTYFDEVYLVAASNHTAYYSIIDPSAQNPIYLSTPYVNTLAGTGISGLSSNQAASNARIGKVIGQPATDSYNNTYFGTNSIGWRLQKVSQAGTITTVAGNYRYFYGDGRFPLSAAFGPALSVSIPVSGTLMITDISNVRLRYVTNDPIVTTVAGTGVSAYSGDGGLAYNATFSTPTTTVTDQTGRLFVADRKNQVIRVITGSTIATYAGTGVAGSSGDGGPATAATFREPYGLAVDPTNNLLITDLSNSVIRTISPGGTIQRIAGRYTSGFGGDGGLANSSILSYPRGITVDVNNAIYVCDTGNSRVRRIDPGTSIITTVAGNGVNAYGGDGGLATLASLSTPTGVTTDNLGNLYIADTGNQCVRYVNMSTNVITTVAGQALRGGYSGDKSFARFALMSNPDQVVFDPGSRYYYIADSGNSRIRYVNAATNIIFSAAGNGSPISAGDGGAASNAIFGSITSVATDLSNNIYLSDGLANSIRRIDAVSSIITTVAGTGVAGFSGDGGVGPLARINNPQTIVLDSDANLFFTDTGNHRVRRVAAATSTITTVAGTGVAGFNADNISSISSQLNFPKALAIDAASNVFVGDTSNFRIRRLDPTGYITTYCGNGVEGIIITGDRVPSTTLGITSAIAVDRSQTLYIADSTTSALWSLSTTGMQPISALSTPAYLGDAGPLSNAYFNSPTGLFYGADDNFVICDNGNLRLRKSYTFGRPLNPVYINMSFAYTNYFTSTGMGYITLNGNLLKRFDGSEQQNQSYSLTDANILDYPLQNSNPVYGNQIPYVEITQLSSIGYTKLVGTMWANDVPGQSFLNNMVDSNNGIIMNQGSLIFPYQNNGITIENSYNDASLRTVNYTGSLNNLSDPAFKENVHSADLDMCCQNLAKIPLRAYNYIEPYCSTFHVRDTHRIGFITKEVETLFPKSIQTTAFQEEWGPSTIQMLDMSQIKYTHMGVTQALMQHVSTLENELHLCREELRRLVAQRNSIL